MKPIDIPRSCPGWAAAVNTACEALALAPGAKLLAQPHRGGLRVEVQQARVHAKLLESVNDWLLSETRTICHRCGSRDGIFRPRTDAWFVLTACRCDECDDEFHSRDEPAY